MKQFAQAEIDWMRSFFTQKECSEVQVSLGGREFSYFVVPISIIPEPTQKKLQEKLPDFVMRLTGEGEGYVLGISDSVREEFRPYAVLHEYIEFMEIGIDTPGRCLQALEEELMLVPEGIKDEYLQMRKGFFGRLIDYCSGEADYTPQDIEEMRHSHSRLEELTR
jgi:hypothetical protein